MFFINSTESIGVIIGAGTTGITGGIIATLFFILMILIIIAVMFGIPLEFLAVLVLPFCICVAAFYGNFIIPLILILIFVSMLIAKNWLFR